MPEVGDNVILARVSVDVVVPNGKATEQEITDWLRFYIGHSGFLRNSNPLVDEEPEVLSHTIKWDVVQAGIKG